MRREERRRRTSRGALVVNDEVVGATDATGVAAGTVGGLGGGDNVLLDLLALLLEALNELVLELLLVVGELVLELTLGRIDTGLGGG